MIFCCFLNFICSLIFLLTVYQEISQISVGVLMYGERSNIVFVAFFFTFTFGLLICSFISSIIPRNKRSRLSGIEKSCFTVYSAKYFFRSAASAYNTTEGCCLEICFQLFTCFWENSHSIIFHPVACILC
jgi:hypothetical protein